MCHFCHTLGHNRGAPPHRSHRCTDPRNTHGRNYQPPATPSVTGPAAATSGASSNSHGHNYQPPARSSHQTGVGGSRSCRELGDRERPLPERATGRVTATSEASAMGAACQGGRGPEDELRKYRKEHSKGDGKHTAHYWSHELNKYVKVEWKSRGDKTSRDKHVDHPDNFRMVKDFKNTYTADHTKEEGGGQHRTIDEHFMKAHRDARAGKPQRHYHNKLQADLYEQRWKQQVKALKASGGIHDKDYYDFLRTIGEIYGYDLRALNGSRWQTAETPPPTRPASPPRRPNPWNVFQNFIGGMGFSRPEIREMFLRESRQAPVPAPEPRRPNAWNVFQNSIGGMGFSRPEIRAMYHEQQVGHVGGASSNGNVSSGGLGWNAFQHSVAGMGYSKPEISEMYAAQK